VQVLPATADKVQIIEALGKLRAAKLLIGMRGAPPADLTAVAEVVLRIGGLMQSVPEITEIDINPLTVHAKGEGATALDALIIVG
jgi:acetate---CoA ligase (ADP-forming)